jgi:hypothetical protein
MKSDLVDLMLAFPTPAKRPRRYGQRVQLGAVVEAWTCPGFVEGCGLGIRVSGLTAFCSPVWEELYKEDEAPVT